MDLISKEGSCADAVVVEGACGCRSYFGVSIQRGLSAWGWEALGLAGPFITWKVTAINMNSNINMLHLFSFFRKLCPKLRHGIIIGTEKK